MEYEIGPFCHSQHTVVMMKELFPHLLTLLFFFSFFCLIVGEKRKQVKTHIVEHNNKRWEIKTADGGVHKKGKDNQEDYHVLS